jgi:hypothetical protein
VSGRGGASLAVWWGHHVRSGWVHTGRSVWWGHHVSSWWGQAIRSVRWACWVTMSGRGGGRLVDQWGHHVRLIVERRQAGKMVDWWGVPCIYAYMTYKQ